MCGGLRKATSTAWATGSASGPVIGEHWAKSLVRPTVCAISQELCILSDNVVFALHCKNLIYVCVCRCIHSKNDGLLSWLGIASVLISLINYYTIWLTWDPGDQFEGAEYPNSAKCAQVHRQRLLALLPLALRRDQRDKPAHLYQ
jgi:hypothetical protein